MTALQKTLPFIGLLLLLLPGNAAAQATRPADELNLLAMGDWGEGKPAQRQVADTMAAYVRSSDRHFTALLSAGDNFYVPLKSIDDPVWQDLFEKMYDPAVLNFPFYIALGNHDYDQNKFRIELAYAQAHPESRWKEPGKWYRIDLPADHPLVTILMLDSDRDLMTLDDWNAQIRFLGDELAAPRAPWTICCAHHPLFSNGIIPDNGILQRDWGTLFEKYHVDFYLCGHEHNLQHLEIKGWTPSFILAGGGGAHAHPMLHDQRGPFSRSIYGFVHFDFTPRQATVRYIGFKGDILHEFVRSKSGEVKVTINTPSDKPVTRPLEVIQGLYDKIHPTTEPATQRSATTGRSATTQPSGTEPGATTQPARR